MRCPRCLDEYESHVTTCVTCGLELVAPGMPLPPQVDALLGTFHPAAVEQIASMLERRGIAFHQAPSIDDRVEVVVDRAFRDDLRAELVVNWADLLGRLPQDVMYAVIGTGGIQPGWYDAPQGSWVDGTGRLRVDTVADEAAEQDARRVIGPSLTVLGAVLVLFGWWPGDSATTVAAGVLLVALGVLLPR